MPDEAKLIAIVIVLTLISGFGDANGIVHASRMWQGGRLVWNEFGKSWLGFCVGMMTFWLAIKYLQELGVVMPEIQTVIWFAVTLIGVAAVSGKFFHWQIADQAIAVGVVIGIGWLLFHTGE